jgi:hypothetical protein
MFPGDDFDVDRFASLFSPPTPPATPHLTPSVTHSRPLSTDHHRPALHPRQDSSDSLLLIPVPTASDPLTRSVPPIPESRSHSLEFFGKFVDEAKLASERSKKLFVDEILEHEDDPLYFLTDPNRKASGSAAETDHPSVGDFQDTQPENVLDFTNARPPSPRILAEPPSFDDSPTDTSTEAGLNIPKPLSRSYQNLGTRWMGPILSSSILPSASQTQPLETLFHAESPTVESPRSSDAMSALHAHFTQSSLAAQRRFSTPQHHVSRDKVESLTTISHGSPFAPHPFLPPSGAPGFVDNRSWDKGFSSEYDNSTFGKGLDLEGRKEVTVEVVSRTLADLVSGLKKENSFDSPLFNFFIPIRFGHTFLHWHVSSTNGRFYIVSINTASLSKHFMHFATLLCGQGRCLLGRSSRSEMLETRPSVHGSETAYAKARAATMVAASRACGYCVLIFYG